MGQTVLITGANRGIGLSFVHEYLSRGCHVIAACRNPSSALQDSGAEIIEGVDVANKDSVHHLAQAMSGQTIDILINNAGILRTESLGDINYDDVLRQFEVNAMAPLRVVEALLSNLSKGSKIGLITSRMGSISDNGSGGYYGYRMSKAALNAAGMSLTKDLQGQGVAVAILHPGFVQTDMVGGAGDISPVEAAKRLAMRIDELNLENSGSFWHSNGELLPW